MLPFNIWSFPLFNPYALIRPLLFRMDAERAHRVALNLLLKKLGPRMPRTRKGKPVDDPMLRTSVAGLPFSNPLGLAAGFDKNAEAMNETLAMGFGFAEVGTILPRPQAGNPAPRLFRVTTARAIINRLGFNSDGLSVCLRRLAAWHDSTQPQRRSTDEVRGVIGINIAVNKDSVTPAEDYAASYKKVASYAGYVAVNISSPNTPGLRSLQDGDQLKLLLETLTKARETSNLNPPIFVKIAPDLTDAQVEDIAGIILASGVEGLIVSNTTISRPGAMPSELAKEVGGLSGQPLFDLSTKMLARFYKLTQGRIALIGCGGVFSGQDAYSKIKAGASLVELYTALVYEGPGVVTKIKRELRALLKRDGFSSVEEAVGSDTR